MQRRVRETQSERKTEKHCSSYHDKDSICPTAARATETQRASCKNAPSQHLRRQQSSCHLLAVQRHGPSHFPHLPFKYVSKLESGFHLPGRFPYSFRSALASAPQPPHRLDHPPPPPIIPMIVPSTCSLELPYPPAGCITSPAMRRKQWRVTFMTRWPLATCAPHLHQPWLMMSCGTCLIVSFSCTWMTSQCSLETWRNITNTSDGSRERSGDSRTHHISLLSSGS
ncbi:uncharacterized protein LOC118312642 isoform X2 [Scophthalmus maximus]|uniref:uncharacterized protein LOC118312642 isoform X2 n=1 Tax=Scophthalmus maximus TaxID=52904 RepID=UPI001FA93497|nr:uncharacterized protein LOC118312642 isoform X2 [Scophthalmus maximus]